APTFELPSAPHRAPHVPALPSAHAFQSPLPTMAKPAPSGDDSDLEEFSLKASVETGQTHSLAPEPMAFDPLTPSKSSQAPAPSPAKARDPRSYQTQKNSASARLSLSPGLAKMSRVQAAPLATHSHTRSLSKPAVPVFASASAIDDGADITIARSHQTVHYQAPILPEAAVFEAQAVKPDLSAFSVNAYAKPSGPAVPPTPIKKQNPYARKGLGAAKKLSLDSDDESDGSSSGFHFKPRPLPMLSRPGAGSKNLPPPTPIATVASSLTAFDDEFEPLPSASAAPSLARPNPYAEKAKRMHARLWGTNFQVCDVTGDPTTLEKVLLPKHYTKGKEHCDSIFDHAIAQCTVLEKNGFRVGEIRNKDTAKQDGCLRVRKVPGKFDHVELWGGDKPLSAQADALVNQFIALLVFALNNNEQLDLAPSNFRIDIDGKLVLIDFRETAKIEMDSFVPFLVQYIKDFSAGNPSVRKKIGAAVSKLKAPLAGMLLKNPSFLEICPMEDL
ncbi:MAG TPA: hypothetical protein VLG44_03140, partial [Chlamydiales bacterium]|nr:hypothetical protein [Chlamydiales bacterium]